MALWTVHYLHIRRMDLASAHARQAPLGTQSVQRAALLLRLIASHNRIGLRIVDLCNLTGLQRPTVYRLLQCLAKEGMVSRSPRTRNYHLGHLLYELGLTAAPHRKLEDVCRPALVALAAKTGDMAFLTLRSGYDAVCIDRQEGSFPIRTYTLEIGTRRPLGIGAGSLAILGALTEGECNEVIRFNAPRLQAYNGLTARKLQGMARVTRERGFAVHDGSVSGARAIGIALCDAKDRPYAGVIVSAITNRMQETRWPEILGAMRRQADAIQRIAGH